MTGKILPLRPINWKNLRQDEAEKLIRQRAADTNNIVITDHAYDRVSSREIIVPDVIRILREGYVDSSPEKDRFGGWQIIVKKRIRGCREAAIVTAVMRENDNIIVVTVMWVDLK